MTEPGPDSSDRAMVEQFSGLYLIIIFFIYINICYNLQRFISFTQTRYSWDPAHAALVRKSYIDKLGVRLRDNISKHLKKMEAGGARPHYMSEAVADVLLHARRGAVFREKSSRSRENRSGKQRPAAKSTQGSASTTHLAKKMVYVNELLLIINYTYRITYFLSNYINGYNLTQAIANAGRYPSLGELYKIQHAKKDRATFVDDRSRSVMVCLMTLLSLIWG